MSPHPSRPVARWHGGKWRLAPWIVAQFPPHRIYVEPYGGGASVLLRKPRSHAEIYNDLDGEAVALFRVLRDPVQACRLVELIELTPFSRDEFRDAYEPAPDDLERARRLLVRTHMGFGSNAHNPTFKTGFRSNSDRSGTTPARDWRNLPAQLVVAVDRLRGVVVENRDAREVMEIHDSPETLHYVDPPYLHSVRSVRIQVRNGHLQSRGSRRGYQHEMTDEQHAELLAFLPKLKGAVVLSGYPSALYDDSLGWWKVEKAAHADGARERTEVLWLNPRAAGGQQSLL